MENKKFVFIITQSHETPDVVAGAMQLAVNMAAFDVEIDFFLMNSAAMLAKKGYAETLTGQAEGQFSPLHELLKTLSEDLDVKFHVCASCVKHNGLEGTELIANTDIKPGSFLGEMLMERTPLTF